MAERGTDARRARRFAERRISSRESDLPRQSYSASLLESLWNRTPEPDYAIAAGMRRTKSRSSRIGAGILALILGLALSIAVVELTRSEDAARGTSDALIEQIRAGSASNEELAAANEERDRAQASAQRSALTDEESERLEVLAASASAEEITGPAVIVELRDHQPAAAGDDPRDAGAAENAVVDTDLQTVINGLFSQGAEGVAVNGHRLTGTSAVRSAGRAILVNYDPIEPPYEVVAVGPEALADAFRGSPAADYLDLIETEYGIESTISAREATLPAASVPVPRHASPVIDDQEDLL